MAKKRSLRIRTRLEQNNFIKGLITEASPLTFPENASLAEENFQLNRDGSRQRRNGMDYEAGILKKTIVYTEGTDKDVEHFLWKNAGNTESIDISVLKIVDKFYFYDNNADTVSAKTLNGGNSITIRGLDVLGTGNPVIYNYASINGKLAVVSGYQYVTLLTYDVDTDTISTETRTISIRDTFGIEDTRPVTERPLFAVTGTGTATTFTDEAASGIHVYNLINQGWQDNFKHVTNPALTVGVEGDTIATTFTVGDATHSGIGKMPSNADTIWSNLTTNTSVAGFIGLFNPDELLNPAAGTRNAPRGATIFDNMFVRGSVRATAVSGRSASQATGQGYAVGNATLPAPYASEATGGGLSLVKTFSGRLVFAVAEKGITSRDNQTPSFGDMIFYSQATDGTSGLTKCHTEIDPTSGEDFALLATDGGYITLSGIGVINALETVGSSLFVFADNGVWQINGGGKVFTSSNINVVKITNIGNIAKKSVVEVENKLFYVSDAGIQVISLSESDASLPATVSNITQGTIQSFLDELPIGSKERSVSVFDRQANSIKWLVNSTALPDNIYFDTEIILDLNLKAFYINKIKTVSPLTGYSPYVIGYLSRPTALTSDVEEDIVVSGVPVVVSADPVVLIIRTFNETTQSSEKYWTAEKIDAEHMYIGLAEYRDTKFRDWASIANDSGGFGADAYAFLLTGYLTGGESATEKRVTYITSYLRRTERAFTASADGFEPDNPSSCLLTAQWEWTSHVDAGRWSNQQEVYRLPRTFIPDSVDFDYGYEVVTTKTKLRGKGKALSLLFETSPLKDCLLYGWSYEINAEKSV